MTFLQHSEHLFYSLSLFLPSSYSILILMTYFVLQRTTHTGTSARVSVEREKTNENEMPSGGGMQPQQTAGAF